MEYQMILCCARHSGYVQRNACHILKRVIHDIDTGGSIYEEEVIGNGLGISDGVIHDGLRGQGKL